MAKQEMKILSGVGDRLLAIANEAQGDDIGDRIIADYCHYAAEKYKRISAKRDVTVRIDPAVLESSEAVRSAFIGLSMLVAAMPTDVESNALAADAAAEVHNLATALKSLPKDWRIGKPPRGMQPKPGGVGFYWEEGFPTPEQVEQYRANLRKRRAEGKTAAELREEGTLAFEDGVPRSKNPYARGTRERRYWRVGWAEGERAAELFDEDDDELEDDVIEADFGQLPDPDELLKASIPQLTEAIAEIDDVGYLGDLVEREEDGANRDGAKKALNKRLADLEQAEAAAG